jgi:hypothetical protein
MAGQFVCIKTLYRSYIPSRHTKQPLRTLKTPFRGRYLPIPKTGIGTLAEVQAHAPVARACPDFPSLWKTIPALEHGTGSQYSTLELGTVRVPVRTVVGSRLVVGSYRGDGRSTTRTTVHGCRVELLESIREAVRLLRVRLLQYACLQLGLWSYVGESGSPRVAPPFTYSGSPSSRNPPSTAVMYWY